MSERIKAGDKLVRTITNTMTGIPRRDVLIVDRVTETGRVKVGPHELNADLTPRWLKGGSVRFERCTPELEAEVQRENAERAEEQKLRMRINEIRLSEIPLGQLRQVMAILSQHSQGTGETR